CWIEITQNRADLETWNSKKEILKEGFQLRMVVPLERSVIAIILCRWAEGQVVEMELISIVRRAW
ncbi:MAG: hypothetical protein WBE68_10640, partial [Candidatus Nitrosopolaris sp.]